MQIKTPFILFLEDTIKKTKVLPFYTNFKSVSSKDSKTIREIQTLKLQQLIRHAFSNIPWYFEAMDRVGLGPEDIVEIDDLAKLPILTRDDIRQNNDKILWKGYKGKIFNGSSSGTTGIPLKYFQDVNGTSAGIAAWYLLMEFSGWKFGMRNVHIWGNNESIQQWATISSKLKQFLYSRLNIPSTLLNDPAQVKKIIEMVVKFKPLVIDGYTNSIYELANQMQKHDIRLDSRQTVFTTAENLDECSRALIEEIIGPVSDLYGCGEVNGIAVKPFNDDKYYIFDPHVIVETIPGQYSDMKEILVTDLNNYYMPFIRYKIGDLIDEVHPASSSNQYPLSFFTKIYGRTADHISLPDGQKLFPINIFGGTLYRKYPDITRHKTTWDGQNLCFIFEIKNKIDIEALKNEITVSLYGYNIEFEIRTTEKLLPGPNGKYKYFELLNTK